MKDFEEIILKIPLSGLTREEAKLAFNYILEGKAEDQQIEKFLLSLKERGETIEEISAGADVMIEKALYVKAPNNAIDTCGTGGDSLGSYNISTATSLVAAGAGAFIAKHGNRALSSKSGSSEVLEELGVKLNIDPSKISKCIFEAKVGFMYAPNHHPAMKFVGPTRKKLGVRTIFNLLGPLSNPARVKRQIMGVYDKRWLEPIARTLKDLGSKKAWIISGSDGMDEITTTGISYISELNEGRIKNFEFNPQDYGINLSSNEDLRGGNPKYNADKIRSLLDGEIGPFRDIVVLNSGVALFVSGITTSIEEGIEISKESIDKGKALTSMRKLIEISNS